ncbi:anti-sigma factor, partial [Azospirillum sp. B506]|uniref:anti-sigma factor family protein n=1 Tax=Azospirillum sp. B506 TaxID=137721 RepID=UPI0005B27A42
MSGTRDPVTEAELHAWLDGELPEERLAEVESHLADNPEVAQRFERYRAQRSLLGQSFGPLIDQPLPDCLTPPSRRAILWKNRLLPVAGCLVGNGDCCFPPGVRGRADQRLAAA